jgi:60 kDa SS-A/Ro ribonucleoprotein
LMLTGIEQTTAAGEAAGSALDKFAWREIARRATWQQLRMSLNTFARHQVFEDKGLTRDLARKLSDPAQVRSAKAMPYQLLMAWKASASGQVPTAMRDALERAMEVAITNVPALPGQVYVCCDVSGSMHSAVTGYRAGGTTAVRCIDVAGLMSAAVLRKNPSAQVIAFEHRIVDLKLRAKDSVMRNAEKLAAVGGGGTTCSLPLEKLNAEGALGDWVIFVSDNESWCDPVRGAETAMLQQWRVFKARNPGARLVCIDIQPGGTTQAHEARDVLNVGGFSDVVFEVIAGFAEGGPRGHRFVDAIEAIEV